MHTKVSGLSSTESQARTHHLRQIGALQQQNDLQHCHVMPREPCGQMTSQLKGQFDLPGKEAWFPAAPKDLCVLCQGEAQLSLYKCVT